MNIKNSSGISITIILAGCLLLSGCGSEQQARISGSVGGAGVPEAERSDAGMKEISGHPIIMLAEGDTSETQAIIPENSEPSPVTAPKVIALNTQTAASETKTPVKIIASATAPTAYSYQVNNIDGIGNWAVDAKLSESIEFWNIGSAGGEKYATAIYTQTWTPMNNGRIVSEVEFNKALNQTVWRRKDAPSAPEIPPKIETIRFSGGLNGKFSNNTGVIDRYKIVPDGKGGLIISGTNLALFIDKPEALQ